MARSSSVISVSIIGDAKKLIGAVGTADKATGGLLKSAAKIGGSLFVIDKVFEVVDSSLKKADDFNDAFGVLERTIGKVDADKIKSVAFSMTNIGLSADEVGVLATSFANFAQSAGIAAPTISALTPDILDIAAAIHAQSPDKTLDEIVADIGKAAGGSQKPVKDLGVVIDKSLNPDEQLRSILDQLKIKYGDASTAAGDFAGSQDTVNAKWDNFTIKLGQALDGPLKNLLTWINDEIDAIPGAIAGFEMLEDAMYNAAQNALAPFARLRDILEEIFSFNINSLQNVSGSSSGIRSGRVGGIRDRDVSAALARQRIVNGLGQ